MKKIFTLLSIILSMTTLITSCGNKQVFTLQGNLGTQKGETFLVVYDDPIGKIDTIAPIEGEFEYSFLPDTMTLIRLVSKDGITLPIFADKGWKVDCHGTFQEPRIEGNAHTADYYRFQQSIQGITQFDSIQHRAEQFIRKNPQSFASAYLIDRYFIQAPQVDMKKVNSLITPLNGEVKDSRVLNVAMKSMPTGNDLAKKTLSYFSLTDRNGKYLSWNSKKSECILINFWASWDNKSRASSDTLYAQIKKLPKESIRVFNVSLDYDKKAWLKACRKDLDSWVEICNFTGWETSIVKQNHVLSLPSNILINNQRNILAVDVFGDELKDKVMDIYQENKKKNK